MKKLALIFISIILIASIAVGCTNEEGNSELDTPQGNKEVVNVYTDRHYDTDEELYKTFTEETGIKVNIVKADSDELIERLSREGESTEADVLITADAGRLDRAKQKELLQSVESETLSKNVPDNLKDVDSTWYGLTVRGRVIVYSKDRVNPDELSTYQDLTSEKWNGKVLVRSSSNIYNQSLLSSFIELYGEEEAEKWAKGIVNNMARNPQGNDRDQAKAVVAGEGDLAIMNTYYMGKMLNSSDPQEVEVANEVGVFFPNQNTDGTHINVSGAGVTKNAKNPEQGIKLIEFLSSEKAQEQFAEANYEYPVNDNVNPSELLQSWGDFNTQDINLSTLGEHNTDAVKIFDRVGWK
ncbi:Fe(3+) ABC transporter substrate-binding protein [Clostridium sp. D2Q-11]|uniref:Fe(3+) ABC transporter substrate-binding protein n=1 Tax=Anaeromonas frigoriresistens TaxID=2683708 RepID=A0A942UY47_9FIRM|nr:Fe(3+) ABC transporter substrate-binding protein [Anaeromonas frigoriresistens]MBS4539126.1 Fe(3+) ABC transporter substrate-binding protein [Anaeromonas frigoriresistens]